MSDIKPRDTHDPEFYFQIAQFSVQGVLFVVPTHPLMQSPFFRNLFCRDDGSGIDSKVPEVYSFTLSDVTASEFRDLLRVIMTVPSLLDAEKNRKTHNSISPPTPPSSWSSVLRLAKMWGFEKTFYKAIPIINTSEDCVVRFALGVEYDDTSLVGGGLSDIVHRDTPLSLEDYQILGLELAVKVARYRELCLTSGTPYTAFDTRIGDIFGDRVMEHVRLDSAPSRSLSP